ncbi:hypothetical protein N0V93_007876 [Gnomoniopsis smithogilvyi]|uniref:Methyltransferase domain-containing protein n=1 Tax=Gnomoniopsis smithogilvyi TaxID=1191159 RepID=A0A9W9CU84_9PEZI|nr:hypothetical protein N0V93_007876 [Gnomoniopsis smithogilvyi]
MSQKPDFSTDFSGPYPQRRLIPKRPDPQQAEEGSATGGETTEQQQNEQPNATAARSHLWFEETTIVPDAFRKLLVEYSHIPSEEVDEHVVRVRNRAWEVHPYPCLGQFRFLELNLSHRPGPLYPRLLSLLTSSTPVPSDAPVFLDIGTCLGQDIRALIAAGAHPSTVAGAELSGTFIDLGYELFRDDPQTVRMVRADVLAPLEEEGNALAGWRGKLKVVQLGMILHLFSWEEGVRAFENAIALLRDEKGVLIIGQATGNVDGLETRTLSPGGKDRATWKHNVETFQRLVKEVETKTGKKWEVRATLDEGLSVNDGKRTWDNPKTRRLLFEVERTE